MSGMFYGPIFTSTIKWLEDVTDLSRLFQDNTTFNGDISGWERG